VIIGWDFNLSPNQLDKRLTDLDLFVKRVPFTGDHHSFRRWDSSRNVMQRSSIDHLVWNGAKIPSCSLTEDGFFALDHIPIIVDTRILASKSEAKITRLVRNATLKFSDRGACRRYVNRINRHADSFFDGLSSPPTLLDLTNKSVEIVNDIHKRRNNLISPSLWSPIAAILSLRCSAIGSTIRLGFVGHSTSLKRIVTRLARDEKKFTLNDDEQTWLDDNFLQSLPFEWNEWRNEYPTPSHAVRELLRIRSLLTKENRSEFRRIHGGRMCKLQEAADAGRIGGVLRSVVGRDPDFSMESLRQGDDTVTDGYTIHKAITDFFSKWFQKNDCLYILSSYYSLQEQKD
jgi:hypothetical protein